MKQAFIDLLAVNGRHRAKERLRATRIFSLAMPRAWSRASVRPSTSMRFRLVELQYRAGCCRDARPVLRRAAPTAAGNPPEMARLEAALAVLATTDNAEVIEEYDHLVDIARRRLPLRTRVRRDAHDDGRTAMIRGVTHEVTAGGKRIGHVVQSSRGFAAHDARNVQVGTYATVERAIAAVADLGPKSGPKLANTADNGRLPDRR